jgi:hypothetical protein
MPAVTMSRRDKTDFTKKIVTNRPPTSALEEKLPH